MNINLLIKKNLTIIIIALLLITIVLTGYCLLILLNSKAEITTIIQFLGVTVALIVGMITALFSWDNTQNVIENNEKQLMIVEKYELLLEMNIKLQSFKLQSKNNPLIDETGFTKKDYNNYLTLIYIQNILENNKKVFMMLFPRTLLNYTQFKFTFTENLSSVLPKNKSHKILRELFKELFKKTETSMYPSLDLSEILYPEMINDIFPNLKTIVSAYYEDTDENLKDYRKGIESYFKELNNLIEIFNKEFGEQKIKYDIC